MSYASDTDADEQCAQGIDHANRNNPLSEFEKMLQCFGYDAQEWADLSSSDRANYTWNWKHIQNRGRAKP